MFKRLRPFVIALLLSTMDPCTSAELAQSKLISGPGQFNNAGLVFANGSLEKQVDNT